MIIDTEDAFYAGLSQHQVLSPIDGLTVIGCNGWYRVEDEDTWLGYMNDGRFVGRAAAVNARAAFHAAWLDAAIGASENRVIVVTHTAPTEASLDPRYDGHYSNAWYWNPLLQPILAKYADKILVWHHGHTHRARQVHADGVWIVTNPRGYPRENPDWKPLSMTVEF